jgi:hypothetical protein
MTGPGEHIERVPHADGMCTREGSSVFPLTAHEYFLCREDAHSAELFAFLDVRVVPHVKQAPIDFRVRCGGKNRRDVRGPLVGLCRINLDKFRGYISCTSIVFPCIVLLLDGSELCPFHVPHHSREIGGIISGRGQGESPCVSLTVIVAHHGHL